MRIRSLLVIVTTLAVSCSGPVGAIPTSVHLQGNFEDASGTEMRYLVWLPDGYGDDREAIHPMIVFLHGSGSDTYDSEFVIAMGLPAVLAQGEQPENFDFVVIAPQAAPGSSWGVGEQLDVVDRLVAEVVDTYLVDPDRVYLTGLSMGGYASWHLATRHPDRYAAMVSVSGSGYQLQTLPPPDYACRLGDVPIWAIHGKQDLIAGYEPVHAQVEAWEKLCGARVEWTSYDGAGHIETVERAYRDPAVYDWMAHHARG